MKSIYFGSRICRNIKINQLCGINSNLSANNNFSTFITYNSFNKHKNIYNNNNNNNNNNNKQNISNLRDYSISTKKDSGLVVVGLGIAASAVTVQYIVNIYNNYQKNNTNKNGENSEENSNEEINKDNEETTSKTTSTNSDSNSKTSEKKNAETSTGDSFFGSSWFSRNFYEGGFESKMTKREAALILGVRESADTNRIKDAHRKILLNNHPDRGGSDFLAAKINEAKDLLMKGKE